MLACIHTIFQIRPGSRRSWLSLGVCAAPLALHLVAIDAMRLTSWVLCSAFLVLWIMAETQPATGQARWLSALALPVLCYNAFLHVSLYDYYSDRFSPGVRLLVYAPAIALVSYFVIRQCRRWRKNR
jgi:hypothetical protein